MLLVVRVFRYFVEDKTYLVAPMEHPTALPERQTLARVVTEADISSLNRYRPKIVVTHVEPEAEAREIGISGESSVRSSHKKTRDRTRLSFWIDVYCRYHLIGITGTTHALHTTIYMAIDKTNGS